MQIRRKDVFTTIHTEGAILPSDLLQRIAEPGKDIPGGRSDSDIRRMKGFLVAERLDDLSAFEFPVDAEDPLGLMCNLPRNPLSEEHIESSGAHASVWLWVGLGLGIVVVIALAVVLTMGL